MKHQLTETQIKVIGMAFFAIACSYYLVYFLHDLFNL